MDGSGMEVLLPERTRDFSLFHSVQTGSAAHLFLYTIDRRNWFPWAKAAEA
jgi:hypothetical protein